MSDIKDIVTGSLRSFMPNLCKSIEYTTVRGVEVCGSVFSKELDKLEASNPCAKERYHQASDRGVDSVEKMIRVLYTGYLCNCNSLGIRSELTEKDFTDECKAEIDRIGKEKWFNENKLTCEMLRASEFPDRIKNNKGV